jgi:hypothetical protein
MLWLCILMVNFSGRLRQLVRSSLCVPRRGIPLLTPRLPHTRYEKGPRQVLAGSPKFPVPRFFSRFGQKNSRLVTTGIRSQDVDKTRKIPKESAVPDAESNVFPVIFPVHGNLSVTAAVTEAEGLTRARRGSARSPRRCPKAPNRRAHRGAWWLRSRIRQRRACR